MNLKVIAGLMVLTLALSFVAPLVVAEDTIDLTAKENKEVVGAGINPDSVFYGLDRAMERLSLAFTFKKAKKAEKALKYAEERLAEAEEMAEENNLDEVDKVLEDHDELVEEATEIIEEVEGNGDEEAAEEALEEVIGLQKKLMTHSEKVAMVKNRILEKHRVKLGNATTTSAQIAHLEEVFGKVIIKAQTMEKKVAQKKENAKTKYKVVAGKTDAEVDDVVEGIEEDMDELEAETEEESVGIGEEWEANAETTESGQAGNAGLTQASA